MLSAETCDDGNLRDADGGSSSCVNRLHWRHLPGREALTPRWGAATAWTGRELFVRGGIAEQTTRIDGGLFSPATRRWRPTQPAGAPSIRTAPTSAWTGKEVIVWGGYTSGFMTVFANGARFNPVTNTWRPMSNVNVPAGRFGVLGVWTGTEMSLFGGYRAISWEQPIAAADGGAYDPVTDRWRPLPTVGAPSARFEHTTVRTGVEMVVWGGLSGNRVLDSGVRYDPVTDRRAPLPEGGAPAPRTSYNATWSGAQMVIFGGLGGAPRVGDGIILGGGARYDRATDAWLPIPDADVLDPRCRRARSPMPTCSIPDADAPAPWTGSGVLVWGGGGINGVLGDGAILDP